jgi:hypothetical protein
MRLEFVAATGVQETDKSDDVSMNCIWGAVRRVGFAAGIAHS